MDEREPMTMSSTSQYYIQYRGIGRSEYGLQAGLHDTPPMIHSMPTPTASPSAQSSDVGGGSVVSTVSLHGSGVAGPAGIGPMDPVKKKRGRPRKYGPDGTMALVLSPQPSSLQGSGAEMGRGVAPSGSTGQLQKRGRGRPPGTGTKQQLASFGEWFAGSAGMGFTPHIITIAIGEDIATKIMSFSQQGPRAVCILSANGSVSTVTLRHPSTSGGTVTYEGRFEILCMSGSYLLTDDSGSRSRSGGLSISLSSPDGRVIGGGVGGLLVAASPVQVIVGSFIYAGSKSKNKMRNVQEPSETEPAVDAKESTPSSPIPSHRPTPPPMGGWAGSSQMEIRNSHIDIDLMRE